MRLTTCSTWQPAVGILLADRSSSCRSPSLEKACRSRRGRNRSRTCQHRSTSSSFECLKNLETSHMMRFRRCKQMWWWCEACLQGSYSMDCPLYGKGERLVVGHKSPSSIMHHASFMFFSLRSLSGCCKVRAFSLLLCSWSAPCSWVFIHFFTRIVEVGSLLSGWWWQSQQLCCWYSRPLSCLGHLSDCCVAGHFSKHLPDQATRLKYREARMQHAAPALCVFFLLYDIVWLIRIRCASKLLNMWGSWFFVFWPKPFIQFGSIWEFAPRNPCASKAAATIDILSAKLKATTRTMCGSPPTSTGFDTRPGWRTQAVSSHDVFSWDVVMSCEMCPSSFGFSVFFLES